jgi:hypothetical protein
MRLSTRRPVLPDAATIPASPMPIPAAVPAPVQRVPSAQRSNSAAMMFKLPSTATMSLSV